MIRINLLLRISLYIYIYTILWPQQWHKTRLLLFVHGESPCTLLISQVKICVN